MDSGHPASSFQDALLYDIKCKQVAIGLTGKWRAGANQHGNADEVLQTLRNAFSGRAGANGARAPVPVLLPVRYIGSADEATDADKKKRAARKYSERPCNNTGRVAYSSTGILSWLPGMRSASLSMLGLACFKSAIGTLYNAAM